VDTSQAINVLDLCAAPGGKSTHIASLINSESLLIANEVIRSRASVVSENIQKWGYPNTIVTHNDPKDFESLAGFFDVIVLDAPCSGEGLFRKDPRATEEWSPQHVALCASRQKRILSDIWPALKENGILIYCTCTYNEEENEANLLWLKQHHDVEFLKLKIKDSWGVEEVSASEVKGYRFFPHRVKGEGFFLSALQKKEFAAFAGLKSKRPLTHPSKKVIENLQSWISSPDPYTFFQHGDTVYFLPSSKIEEANLIAQYLKVVHAGTRIASVKHEKLIPAHALAMSIKVNRENFNTLAVTSEEAIRFLRRDPLVFNEKPKGHYLIIFENTPLGWINHLGNRINNLYPQEWRIRMAAP
jgi:NOL1/NOP2/fmu family ribosome biogenesis protein